MLSAAEAPEVTQDVFVRTWQKLETFRGEAQFGTWLHRLAINVILSRRAGLAKQRERFLPDDAALELLPVRPVRSELRMDFETSIAQLPEGARAIFVMHDVEGYTHEEIAASMGITTGTTKAQLHRARMLLRRTLEAGS
jgi:RNA polymerase sigma-70 factor (ECF subfamily)